MNLRVKPGTDDLAERLRGARSFAVLSQGELAERLNVSRRTLQAWEAGVVPQPKHRRALVAFIESIEAQAA